MLKSLPLQNFFSIFSMFTLKFDEMLSEFRDTSQKMQKKLFKNLEICRDLAKSCAQFPDIFKIAKSFIFKMNNSLASIVASRQTLSPKSEPTGTGSAISARIAAGQSRRNSGICGRSMRLTGRLAA